MLLDKPIEYLSIINSRSLLKRAGFFVPLQAVNFNFDMTEYTITGIRYHLGEFPNIDDATEAAIKYVAGLKNGQPVILMAEPENPVDSKAIAAYIDYQRVGYIDKEETSEVHALLDEDNQCDGVIERTDGHITAFITIPGASDKIVPKTEKHRVLPESPLGENVRMPFTKEESSLQLIATRMISMEVNSNTYRDFIQLAERYVPLLKLSVCNDEAWWMNKIAKKLHKVHSQHKELGMSEDETQKILYLYNKVHEAVGDLHTMAEHWPEHIFMDHLDRLRKDEHINHYLYEKYIDTFLNGVSFAEADTNVIAAEHKRLCDWLRNMKWSELRNPQNLQAMGFKVFYLRLSRKELYDLYSVLLLIEKLSSQLKGVAVNQEEIVGKLKHIFYGDEEAARQFLHDVRDMKPTYITNLVNQLVKERKISDASKKHDLWEVLNSYGIYTKTESNWNMQVR